MAVASGERPRIAILASGSGTTADFVIHATLTGVLQANVGAVIYNNRKAEVVRRVQRMNVQHGLSIATHHVSGITNPGGPAGKGEQTDEESAVIAEICKDYDLILLAGYMKKLRGPLLYLPASKVNTHPGPLPATMGLFGINVQEEVFRQNLTHSAWTFHYADKDYDTGEIIATQPVPVMPWDDPSSLFDAVQVEEKSRLPVALNDLLHSSASMLR